MTDGLQVIGWREVVGNPDLPTDLAPRGEARPSFLMRRRAAEKTAKWKAQP
jgi:hypothetical protein